MAQRPIREVDAKRMRHTYIDQDYPGILVENADDLKTIADTLKKFPSTHRVVKPDQLFGKRGKHGLLGVKLSPKEVVKWIQDHRQKNQDIDWVVGTLDTFLIEPFVAHTDERYIALKTTRDTDVILFSHQGGIDVEENWDKVQELPIPVLDKLQPEQITQTFGELPEAIISFITQLFEFFRTHGLSYLEINPFTMSEQGEIICLDMVARVDTCADFQQRDTWKDITWTRAFWSSVHPLEKQVAIIDAETWASLKMSVINPTWRIGLLLWGWWPSVAIMDTFNNRWLLDQVINYWELSWNPNYWHNKLYIQWLVDILVQNVQENPEKPLWLCYIWWIANFTRIDIVCKALVSALEEKIDQIKTSWIRIFIRRGWIKDKKGLALVKAFCDTHDIRCRVADGDVYITEAMEVIE